MALSKKSVALAEAGFREAFPNAQVHKLYPKSDGGYENVYVELEGSLDGWQQRKWFALTGQIPNSSAIQALDKDKLRLLFF